MKTKKLLSIVLALVMLLGCMTVTAFAEEPETMTCPTCHGEKTVVTGTESCSDCSGTGSVSSQCPTCKGNLTYRETCWNCLGAKTFDCENCSGEGHIDCTSCHGRGYEACETCSGEGTVQCPCCEGQKCEDCDYTGVVTCNDCDGTGNGDECGNCLGTGYFDCGFCEGGKVPCEFCGGEGDFLRICSNCNGGYVSTDCSTCNATGTVTTYGTCPTCAGVGTVPCATLNETTKSKTIDQNYTFTQASEEYTDVTKVKLEWTVTDIAATYTSNKTWDPDTLTWVEAKEDVAVADQSATFKITNYSSKSVKANVAFTVENAVKDTYDADNSSYTNNDCTIATPVVQDTTTTYTEADFTAKAQTITATLKFNKSKFAELAATTQATKYGTYTVTIGESK